MITIQHGKWLFRFIALSGNELKHQNIAPSGYWASSLSVGVVHAPDGWTNTQLLQQATDMLKTNFNGWIVSDHAITAFSHYAIVAPDEESRDEVKLELHFRAKMPTFTK